MMIKLNDGCWVAADAIEEVTINSNSGLATVRMKNGIGHSIGADYGKGIYATVDRLITEINAAKSKGQP